ncbi:MAG: glutamine amidotransferase [Pseudomonadota bacterium]
MKIALLETGAPPDTIRDLFPSYADMFVDLVGAEIDGLTFEAHALMDGAPIPATDAYDGALVTGSRLGVYDEAPWMDVLKAHVREAAGLRKPMVGVCFGHQLIADALGGDVRKSEKGWGLGRHTYALKGAHPWIADPTDSFALAVSHQDQVLAPPADAETIASSEFTPHAALLYAGAPILSFQGHPEFNDSFAAALYNARRDNPLTDDQVDTAVESLAQPEDNSRVGRWIGRFFLQNRS